MNRCKRCYYYAPSTQTCDYLLITGERRPCAFGEGCTVFYHRGTKPPPNKCSLPPVPNYYIYKELGEVAEIFKC